MNLWKQFSALTPAGGPLYIGVVTSVNGIYAAVTLLPGDAAIVVNGIGRTLEIGQRWLIQGDKIIDEAPSGEVYLAEV